MSDTGKPSTSNPSPGNPSPGNPSEQKQEDVKAESEAEETDSSEDLDGIDTDQGNNGVQKNMAKLLKILVKDQRRRTEYRTEVRKPTDFRGTESARDARNWIKSFERYFKSRKTKRDEEKINTTLSYLVGKAAEFARRVQEELDAYEDWELEDVDDRSERAPAHCSTWNDFKTRFLHEFVDVDPTLSAREELRKLRMESDQKAEEFLTSFKNLASETGYDEAALIDMLQLALIPRITSKILELRKRPADVAKDIPNYRPETLDEWYEMAGDLDRSYRLSRQRMNEIRGQNTSRSTPTVPAGTTQKNLGYRNNSHSNSGGGQGSGNNRRTQFHARVVKDMSEVVCFRCDKKGHISRDCPTRASGSGQQQRTPQPTNIRSVDISDDTLQLLARALQSASAQQTSTESGKGKQAQKGFRRGRK